MNLKKMVFYCLNSYNSYVQSSRHNFKKQFGQNFLKSTKYVHMLLNPLEISKNDLVIEIGPGDGMVTNEILRKGATLYSIEIDDELIPKLQRKFIDYENFNIVHTDVLDLDLNQVAIRENQKIKITGSLPYNISKKIISKFLKNDLREKIESMSFIVQDEVAKAYVDKVPKASFLSMKTALYAKAKKYESIPAVQFVPKPKVAGGIIYLELNHKLEQNVKEIEKLMKIGFSSPRKTLYNNLKSSKKYQPESILIALSKLEINEKARPSELELDDWIKLNIELT